ncbi:hypothetical protein Droror1_Dr00000417 [Drosera rotundifolia]
MMRELQKMDGSAAGMSVFELAERNWRERLSEERESERATAERESLRIGEGERLREAEMWRDLGTTASSQIRLIRRILWINDLEDDAAALPLHQSEIWSGGFPDVVVSGGLLRPAAGVAFMGMEFGLQLDNEKRLNVTYIINVVRKLGCSIFLLPDDIMEVNQKMILTLTTSIMYWCLQQPVDPADSSPSQAGTASSMDVSSSTIDE